MILRNSFARDAEMPMLQLRPRLPVHVEVSFVSNDGGMLGASGTLWHKARLTIWVHLTSWYQRRKTDQDIVQADVLEFTLLAVLAIASELCAEGEWELE